MRITQQMSGTEVASICDQNDRIIDLQWKTPTNGLLTWYRLKPSDVGFSDALALIHKIEFLRLEYTMSNGSIYLLTFQARSGGRCVTASSQSELVAVVLCSLLK